MLFEDKVPSLSLLVSEIEYDEYEVDEDVRISEAKKPSRISLLVRPRYICCLLTIES